MDLSVKYKALFQYVHDKCSNIGIWKPNKKMAQFVIGEEIDLKEFADLLGECRLKILPNGNWWLLKFINFQYGSLPETSNSPPIRAYITKLKEHNLWIPYRKAIDTLKEKEKEKDQEKEKEKESGLPDNYLEMKKERGFG